MLLQHLENKLIYCFVGKNFKNTLFGGISENEIKNLIADKCRRKSREKIDKGWEIEWKKNRERERVREKERQRQTGNEREGGKDRERHADQKRNVKIGIEKKS